MADGTELNEGSGGDKLLTAGVTFSDESMKVQGVGLGILSGSAESFTYTLIVGGTGVDAAGVQRVSLATDVPLPTGANAIGKLAANSGVDIGDVTINGMDSIVDSTNSSTATLAEDAVFTGTSRDTLNYGHITITVWADQVSATDGLSVQWSSDGTSWDNTDVFTIPASTGKVFTFGPVSRYFRVVYTNGGAAQGAFRLESILRIATQSSSSHRIAESISGQDDAELVKAVVTGMAPDTSFKNLLVTNAGEMKVSLENLNGVTVPVSQSGTWNIATVTTVTTVSTVTNLAQLGGQAIAMGTGARSAGTQRVTIATDDVVPVTGTFWQATQPVSGTFWQATQPVSGTVTANAGTNLNTSALATEAGGNLAAAAASLAIIDDIVVVLGTATYTETTTKGNVIAAVRNDDLATLANTDNELAPLQVDAEGAVYVNPAAAEPKRASGVAAGGTPGTDDIVAAVGSRKIRVLAISLIATSTTTNSIYLDNADNDLLFNVGNPLAMSLDADGDTVAGFVLPYNPGGWFETDTVNEAVTLNSSAAQDIAWTITYIEVP